VREEYLTLQLGYDLLKTLVLIKLVVLTYGTIKLAIPRIHPGLHDLQLLRIDRWLHGGVDPATASVGLLGAPLVTRAIDVLYVGWYFVKVTTLVVFVLTKDRRLHAQFFGAYYSLWIVGGLAALLLPSLGPVYVRPETFASLHKPWATALQQHLVQHYPQAGASATCPTLIYEGIAAFPSLHVAAAALFTCFLMRVSRPLALLMALFTVVTQIGAVHLGWHYAVDGYAGVLLASALSLVFLRGLRPVMVILDPGSSRRRQARTSARAGWPPVATPGPRTKV
jgi:hypothetical protein